MKNKKRQGEINHNKFGSIMQIIEYNSSTDILINFPEYNWMTKTTYGNFKKGEVKCPYEKRYCGVGYIGEGKYKMSENGKLTKYYRIWYNMLNRCYNNKIHDKFPTYKDCYVCDEWLNFQIFAEWCDENFYSVNNEIMCLDKDILNKRNKMYSPNTCVFVPNRINTIFIKSDKKRGNLPIGVTTFKGCDKFRAICHTVDDYKLVHLGVFCTIEEAFKVYKQYKETMIKRLADEYQNYIPNKLYQAMYNYKVEIDD